ncbi:DNA-processing protein DprA [Paenibacillus sp. UMB4589-SE434]|uniref:DNA-processing protein DprA n=1 Tax=Paenibacillus sp. UMB4589-SE434 TaxID=3046314 RepID=UPI00254F62B7|nr:DNA-processing protein DprA [Paenibacillus sp. UMB4589-SE434]MDK8180742.1 DNA-processing protein DprA [Paenibacillus sp. UMB4589-SE434]
MGIWSKQQLLFGLHCISGVGWHTIQLCSHTVGLNGLEAWLDRNEKDWHELGVKPAVAQRLSAGFTVDSLDRQLELTYKSGTQWITLIDEPYPELLKHIHEPPWVLFGRGDMSLLSRPSIAMVGTRQPTVYGKKVAHKLAVELTERKLIVVSGLARGIDAASHEGALTKGETIAVLGTPCEVTYPPEHSDLARRISLSGIVISEYPMGTAPHPGLFPRRNRIIAGLTLGTIVVEAAQRSGALITAYSAMESSREVYVIPGPITSPKSAGTLQLLKDSSAKAIDSANDIIADLRCRLTTLPETDNNGTVMNCFNEAALTASEQAILDRIEDKPSTMDELLRDSELSFAELHHILLSLQLKKRIHERPGAVYGSIWT